MKRSLGALILLLLLMPAQALADVLPFTRLVQNISSNEYGGNKKVWSIAFDEYGLAMVGASDRLCVWDGREWSSYQAHSIIRSLCFDQPTGRLYCSGDNFFGYWTWNGYGDAVFTTLHTVEDNLQFKNYWRIIPSGGGVFVQTHEEIVCFDLKDNSMHTLVDHSDVGYIFRCGNDIVGQVDGQLCFVRKDRLTPTGIFVEDRIVAVSHPGEDWLIVSESSGIKRVHDGQLMDELPALNRKIGMERVFSAEILGDGEYLLGTVMNGVYIIDKDGEILTHLSEGNGMDYSTVLCVAESTPGDFWFGLDGGIAHFDSKSPEYFYRCTNQKIGDVYSAVQWRGSLYLGTNKGLYRVDENSEAHAIEGIRGVIWSIEKDDDFLVLQYDDDLCALYPDGFVDKLLTNVWKLSRWKEGSDVFLCSDISGIVFFEKKDGRLRVRNRLGNYDGYMRVSAMSDRFGDLWVDGLRGCVQRIVVDKDMSKVIDIQMYEVGDGQDMVSSHYLDGGLVFTQGKDSYIYDRDSDTMVKSAYYSSLTGRFNSDIASLLSVGNMYFHYSDASIDVAERSGNDFSFMYDVFSSLERNVFSENYSSFIKLNDSLVVLGCTNGLAAYDIKASVPRLYASPHLRQVQYRKKNRIHKVDLSAHSTIDLPRGTSDLMLTLIAIPQNTAVYYSLDNDSQTLLHGSSISIPYLPYGKHKVHVTDNYGMSLLEVPLYKRPLVSFSFWPIVSILAILAALFGIFWAFYRRVSIALRKKYDAKQQELLEKERLRFENESLSIELRERNMKLTSLALNDININTILKEIEAELSAAASKSADVASAVQPARQIVTRYVRENGSWKSFEHYFNGVYNGFFDRLKAKYPKLTLNDLKICSYIRLGMSTKEMASLMNIELSSAESARYRLRKNMGLSASDSLTDIIWNI